MTAMLKALARGAWLSLEGGYNLRSISRSMEACARVLLGDGPLPSLVPSTSASNSSVAALGMGIGRGRGESSDGRGGGGSGPINWRRNAGRVIMTSAWFAPRIKHMQCVAETMMLQSEFWRDVLFPIMSLRKKEADFKAEKKELIERLQAQDDKMQHASMRWEREREKEREQARLKEKDLEMRRKRERDWEKSGSS